MAQGITNSYGMAVSPNAINVPVTTNGGGMVANNHIHVSIHSKHNNKLELSTGLAAGSTGAPNIRGANGGQLSNSASRIKRVGPINKGDKIKFGVLVSNDLKRKKSSSDLDHMSHHEIFATPKQMHK